MSSSTRRILGLEQRRKQQKMKKKEPKMIKDERFASAQSDPRFMEAPKRHSKVTIDSRFQRIFTDRSFVSSRAPVDKRGRPKTNNASSSSLAHYYRLQEENDPEIDAAQVDQIGNPAESKSGFENLRTLEKDDNDDDDDDDDGQSVDESSSTTSTTDSDDDNYMDSGEEDTLMLQENNVPEIDSETRRLAVVNLDWSQVRAVDLYVLLTSFLPKGGQILSVSVYPSEFGLKRMEEEAVRGPVGLFDDEDKHDDVDDDDDEIDQSKLRAYELSRLRYYYAVVECDSVATADYLYKTCDGVEFERSANKLDLRFVPDSMDFKHQPRDVATEVPADYEGLDFQTRALQHSNIHLTWDEDEPQRAKTLKRKLNDGQIAELELKEYLASDESESDEDNNEDDVEDKSEKKRDKYRALIQTRDGFDEDEEDDNGHDMEVTFSSGLEEISKRISEKKNKKSETVWEAYLRKRKEKKNASKKGPKYASDDESSDTDEEAAEEAADDFFVEDTTPAEENKGSGVTRKRVNKSEEASIAELELLTADDTNLKGYNIKPKKRKGNKGNDEGKIPTVDYQDPRFSALFTSPLYAPDPTDPQYKRSAAYHRQKQNKSTRTRD
ncbi:pre-rRNA-processing protein esf1-like [Salvia miltiorrhiza]|uniref:pre-rRNA-processing protein esf1-like n=1 Tax=Salvia miltiorrhiza TaxID=226208 RepID=UPI0025AD6A1F|nr:pre-rRNA-processing protein esf1-like [Salvia miltiorrhiza]XP_057765303.1 pre-rRNA-processing protein esf1-like [Salvia miltiorrhiza]